MQTLTHRTPGRAIAADDRITSFDDAKIAALSFESGEPRVVIEGGTYVRYVPSGISPMRGETEATCMQFAARIRIRLENIGRESIGRHEMSFEEYVRRCCDVSCRGLVAR